MAVFVCFPDCVRRPSTPIDPCCKRRWILATIEDYDAGRTLLAPVFDAIAAEKLTPTIRKTVESVTVDEEISEGELAKRLGVSKSTVSYRVGRAVEGGWLVNRETRKGHAARLARAADLPDQASVLPTSDELRQVFECSNQNLERPGGNKMVASGDACPAPESFEL